MDFQWGFTFPQFTHAKHQGVSLIELLLILVIVSILALTGIPSFLSQMQRYRLTSTIQELYYHLQYARSEALKRANTVFVSFQTGSNWCYGINVGSACNCTTPSSCSLGSYTPPSQLTTLSLNNLSTLTFEGSRGTSNVSGIGTITLTVTGGTQAMGIDIGSMGNLTLCSSTISGYSPC